jgi:hypothetical protein
MVLVVMAQLTASREGRQPYTKDVDTRRMQTRQEGLPITPRSIAPDRWL